MDAGVRVTDKSKMNKLTKQNKKPKIIHTFFVSILVILLIMSTGLVAQADNHVEEEKQWERLNELAEEAFEFIENKQYEQARAKVNEIASAFLHIKTGEYVAHVEQSHMISEVIIQAKHSLTAVELDEREVYRDVLRLRLVLNAVYHDQKPMWIHFFPKLKKNINDLKSAIEADNRDQFYSHLNELQNNYEYIRPAIVVSHPPYVYNQLDSQMAYFINQGPLLWQNKDRTAEFLDSFERQIEYAFFQREEGQFQSFLYMVLALTLFILTVLCYVAWKKYKGEKQREHVPMKKYLTDKR